jgi:hypothetical protein
MISSEEFKQYLDFAWEAYQKNNTTDQEYRQNGNVPYITHPLGASLLLLADVDVPQSERELGCKILMLHDVLEDTSLQIPDWIEEKVKRGVEEMTYADTETDESKFKKISGMTPFFKLLTLYDTFWSLNEKHVREFHRKEWKELVQTLAKEAEKNYGNLRIVQMARVVTENTDW